jgi:magnesium transporter
VTSLRTNELLMMKIERTDFLKVAHDTEIKEFFADVLIDYSQAMEMANIYTNILSGTMDAFASIISNNLNVVVKRLTTVTIILMVPTLAASFMGMNVIVPGANSPWSFVYIVGISLLVCVLMLWVFIRQRWF